MIRELLYNKRTLYNKRSYKQSGTLYILQDIKRLNSDTTI